MECRSDWRPAYAEERLARRDNCVRRDPRGTAELKLIHYPSGRTFRVIRQKNPSESIVVYRDDWQVALLPDCD
jgi:hypothetical protein